MNNTRITYFENIQAIRYPHIITLQDGLDMIKHPSTLLRSAVKEIKKAPKTEQNALKVKTLPGLCFCGVFTKREDAALKEYSPLICLDLDDVDDIPKELERIKSFPYVVSAFKSPSGKGIKVVVAHDNNDPAKHKELYHSIGRDMGFTGRSDLKFDLSCSNVSRFCFLSSDTRALINLNAKAYNFKPSPTPYVEPKGIISTDITSPKATITNHKEMREQIQATHELFEKHYRMVTGVRNNHLYILARFFWQDGIPEQVAIDYLVTYYNDPGNDFGADEIERTVRSAYK